VPDWPVCFRPTASRDGQGLSGRLDSRGISVCSATTVASTHEIGATASATLVRSQFTRASLPPQEARPQGTKSIKWPRVTFRRDDVHRSYAILHDHLDRSTDEVCLARFIPRSDEGTQLEALQELSKSTNRWVNHIDEWATLQTHW
jgi:hypothetical protein